MLVLRMRTTTLKLALAAPLLLAMCLPLAGALQVAGTSLPVDPPALSVALRAPFVETQLETSALLTPLVPALPLDLPAAAGIAVPIATVAPSVPARATIPTAPPIAAPEAATAAAGMGAILWIVVERLGAGRAFAALYSRLANSDLLENQRRERVIGMVRAQPGIGPQEIADALGTGWGVTIYHLDKLERAGLITSQRSGHHRCYFVPGAMPRDDQKAVALFRGDTTRRVAQLVQQQPGLTQSELCRALGLSASAGSKQVSRLEAAALVRREASLDGNRLFPEPTLAALA